MPNNDLELYQQLKSYAIYRIEFLNGTGGSVTADIRTIENYFAALGRHSDVRKWKPMAKLLSVLRKVYPAKSQAKRPFSISELSVIYNIIQPKSFDSLIIRSLLAFAIGGALRASEYTCPVKKPTIAQQMNMVRLDRVTEFTDSNGKPALVYFFFRSKTNQSWKAEFAVMPCMCDLDLPCAVHEVARLKQYLKDEEPNSALFTWSNGSYVTYRDALHVFKKVVELTGADPKSIGTHSARKTRIMIGLKQGLPQQILVLIGRWSCFESIRPYLDMSPQDLNELLAKEFE